MTTKITKWEDKLSSIPNEFYPFPWSIKSRKQELSKHRDIIWCGNTKLILSGQLIGVKDGLVIISLWLISAEQKNIEFTTTINKIIGKLGTQYTFECKDSIRKSLARLQEVAIKIMQYDEDGRVSKQICHGIIDNSYYDRKKNIVKIRINEYFDEVWAEKLLIHFNMKFLTKGIKGNVARMLYLAFQRQVSAGTTKGYKIGLEKLTKYIGLDRDNKRELYSKRQQIKNACQELLKKGYLHSFNLNSNDILSVKFNSNFGKVSEKIEQRTEMPQDNLISYAEEKIGIKFDSNRAKIQREILKILSVGDYNRDTHLFEKYVTFLSKAHNDWLKKIYNTVFDINGDIFKNKFLKDYMDLDMPSPDTLDPYFEARTEGKIKERYHNSIQVTPDREWYYGPAPKKDKDGHVNLCAPIPEKDLMNW